MSAVPPAAPVLQAVHPRPTAPVLLHLPTARPPTAPVPAKPVPKCAAGTAKHYVPCAKAGTPDGDGKTTGSVSVATPAITSGETAAAFVISFR